MDLALYYDKPSTLWVEALPLGNGRIGAMVHGGTDEELLCLNEDSLWSGYPTDNDKENMKEYVKKAGELAKQGLYHEAEKILQNNIPGKYSQAYMPMGNLRIKLNHKNITDYSRKLNLSDATHVISYLSNGISYKRTSFISHEDNILVYKIASDAKNSISCEISFDSLLKHETKASIDAFQIEGLCPSHAEPSYLNKAEAIQYFDEKEKTGIRFHSVVKAVAVNGTTEYYDDKIIVNTADEVVIYLSVRSNFVSYNRHPEFSGKEYIKPAQRDITLAVGSGYNFLLSEHISDYKTYYNRVILDICANDKIDIPMNERLLKFDAGEEDDYLPVYLFQYGRYLLISSSRPGTQATNLQGIWNNSISPPWSSNYTININTQMNYWCVFMANLAEFNEPLVQLIRDLSKSGVKTAQEYYGANGFVAHHNTDIWRLTNPVGYASDSSVRYAFWPMSTGWLCQHLFEQYEYTSDIKFLRKTAYPIMVEAAKFYLDTIELDENGYYAMVPSTSPENAFIYEDKVCSVSKTTTMTMAIINELFSNCIKAAKLLNINDDFIEELIAKNEKLYPFTIGSDGRLLEWSEEYPEEDREHRHISHLYPLHPARLITPIENPKLANACREVLKAKGLTGTGWSLSWKVNQWARLFDGENAYKLIKQQLTYIDESDVIMNGGGSYPNLFDAHPPFQIDGNFGIVSGIAEMLVQSYDDKIFILPALPKAWKKGRVRGLKAKNNISVNVSWENGKITELVLRLSESSKIELHYEDNVEIVDSQKYHGNTAIIVGGKTI